MKRELRLSLPEICELSTVRSSMRRTEAEEGERRRKAALMRHFLSQNICQQSDRLRGGRTEGGREGRRGRSANVANQLFASAQL